MQAEKLATTTSADLSYSLSTLRAKASQSEHQQKELRERVAVLSQCLSLVLEKIAENQTVTTFTAIDQSVKPYSVPAYTEQPDSFIQKTSLLIKQCTTLSKRISEVERWMKRILNIAPEKSLRTALPSEKQVIKDISYPLPNRAQPKVTIERVKKRIQAIFQIQEQIIASFLPLENHYLRLKQKPISVFRNG